ncbi:MAG: hypothetical protein HOP34_05100 [Methylococcaceae bacterium]|nr:hypothetical protein [Methylococcaceae bacterium]
MKAISEASLERSAHILEWAVKNIHQVSIPNPNLRKRLAGSSFTLAIDLFNCTLILGKESAQSGVCVLARSILECYVRGFWLAYVADDSTIERFSKNQSTKTLKPLIGAIKKSKSNSIPKNSLADLENKVHTLDSITHGGLAHMKLRNISDDKIGTNLSKQNMTPLFILFGASVVVNCVEQFTRSLLEDEFRSIEQLDEGTDFLSQLLTTIKDNE